MLRLNSFWDHEFQVQGDEWEVGRSIWGED